MGLFGDFNLIDIQNIASGYMESEIKKDQAKAKASAEANKPWLDAAMKIYTNPEYANTNSLLTSVGITPEMGQPFVEAFNQFHIKPEEDITKSKLYEKISNIFTTKESIPTIQKINMTFEDATKNVAAMQKFVSLYAKDYVPEVEDDEEKPTTRELVAKFFDPGTSEKIKAKVAEATKMRVGMPGIGGEGMLLSIENILQYPELQAKFLDIVNGMDEIDAEDDQKFWTNASANYAVAEEVRIDGYDANASEWKDMRANDSILANWLIKDGGADYLKNVYKAGDKEQASVDALLFGFVSGYMDAGNRDLKTKTKVGLTTSSTDFAASNFYRALKDPLTGVPKLANLLLDQAFNKQVKDFTLNFGEVDEQNSGDGEFGQGIVKGTNTEYSSNLTAKESTNVKLLAEALGTNVETMYKNDPALFTINKAIVETAAKIATNQAFHKKVLMGDNVVKTTIFSLPVGDWSHEERIQVLKALEASNLDRLDEITALRILIPEDISPFTNTQIPYGQTFGEGQTPVPELTKVLNDTRKEIIGSASAMDRYRIQVDVGTKLKQLFTQYKNVIKTTDVGAVGSFRVWWNNVYASDRSLLNRISGMISSGITAPATVLNQDAAERGVLTTAVKGELKEENGSYYYIAGYTEDGNEIRTTVDKDVLESMGEEVNAAYDISYAAGQKKALELYIGYTMARLFDDKGRISNMDLELQLQTFRGQASWNIDNVGGAIDVAENLVNQQWAIASKLVGSSPQWKKTLNVNGAPKTYWTAAPIADVKAAHMYKMLLGTTGEGVSPSESILHDRFNPNKLLKDTTAYVAKPMRGATFDNNELFKVTKRNGSNPLGDELPIYVYKPMGSDAWKKVDRLDHGNIKFGTSETTKDGSGTTSFTYDLVNETISFVDGKPVDDQGEEIKEGHRLWDAWVLAKDDFKSVMQGAN